MSLHPKHIANSIRKSMREANAMVDDHEMLVTYPEKVMEAAAKFIKDMEDLADRIDHEEA